MAEGETGGGAVGWTGGAGGMGLGTLFGLDIAAGVAGNLQANQWAQAATGDAQNFAQFMANTTYRRAVRDLRLAGLNPMLAYTQGGAPSPTVGAAEVRSPTQDMEIGRAVGSAKAFARAKDELKILRDQSAIQGNLKFQSEQGNWKSIAEAVEAEARAKIAEADRDIKNATKDAAITSAKESAGQNVLTTQSMRAALELQRAQLPSGKAIAEFDASPEGQFLLKLQRAVPPVEAATGIIRSLKR